MSSNKFSLNCGLDSTRTRWISWLKIVTVSAKQQQQQQQQQPVVLAATTCAAANARTRGTVGLITVQFFDSGANGGCEM
eukprot:COSAG02_NODE_1080_length_14710_cov_46.078913_17_plen_79_part_00